MKVRPESRWILVILVAILAALIAASAAASAQTAKSDRSPATPEQMGGFSATAMSNQWLDGQSADNYQDHFYLGTIRLTTQQVGYWGSLDGSFPRTGDVFWGHIMVWNMTGGAIYDIPVGVVPEVKLPPNTRFAVSTSNPLRTFVNGSETSDGLYTSPGSSAYAPGYSSLNPPPKEGQATIWILHSGESLEIWFPMISSAPLNGDQLYGAVTPLSTAGSIHPPTSFSSVPVYVYARPDVTAPRVVGVVPTSGVTGVARGTNVAATFSEKMDKTTLTKANFKLYKVTSTGPVQITNVTVAPNSYGTKATLNPYGTSSTLLAKSTRYKAVVTKEVKDLAGNTMATQKVWYFKTGG